MQNAQGIFYTIWVTRCGKESYGVFIGYNDV